ncbi:uncharacterized protein [Periplaneta americana]|uniref:uncharacterized protein n=1 Tax=Periplaneta americana TaxID=6978 RepID=UPI0037E72703
MNSAVLVAVLAVLCAVTAYDFDFPILNHYIDSNLEYFHSRQIRSADNKEYNMDNCQHHRRFNLNCCGNSSVIFKDFKDKEMMMKCFREVSEKVGYDHSNPNDTDPFSCETLLRKKERVVCLSQCVARNKDLIDEAGNLKEEKIKQELKKHGIEDWKQKIVDDAVVKCLEEGKSVKVEEGKCNPANMSFGKCIWREVQMNCPAEHRSDTDMCKMLHEEMKKKYGGN